MVSIGKDFWKEEMEFSIQDPLLTVVFSGMEPSVAGVESSGAIVVTDEDEIFGVVEVFMFGCF